MISCVTGTTRDSSIYLLWISRSIAPLLSRLALFGQALSRGFGGPLRHAGNSASSWESTNREPLFFLMVFRPYLM